MTRISSPSTFFYKRIFPLVWFGILGGFSCVALCMAIAEQKLAPLLLIGFPLIMAILGYRVMRWLVLDLMDEVWDCGDSILVKNRRREHRFALSDFMAVGYSGFSSPPRITLYRREASGGFGSEIAFIPVYRWFPYATPRVAKDLMVRVDEARRQIKP